MLQNTSGVLHVCEKKIYTFHVFRAVSIYRNPNLLNLTASPGTKIKCKINNCLKAWFSYVALVR